MKTKKVLLLSLGTGSYALENRDRARQNDDEYVFEQKLSAYRKANYQINRNTYYEKPYVAEPLITETHPDEIVILGSVKSAWSGLYLAFAEETSHMKLDFKKLREYDTGKTVEKDGHFEKDVMYGLRTAGEELDQIEKDIEGIFAASSLFQKLCGDVRTRVLLLRYGVDQDQLEENYHRLGRLRDLFQERDTEYEVSFDITHAFRSMPIYNLIILNYLKNITGANIHIRNVFYGNLEVSAENNKIATIVDLRDIVNVLDLTNGVSEFRNTGNAKTLLENLPPDEQDDYAAALRMFDHATQINDFNMIQKALLKLEKAYPGKTSDKAAENKETCCDTLSMDITQNGILPKADVENRNIGRQARRTRYEDYREMVQRVIATELYGDEKGTYADFISLSMGEQRLRLGKWYMRQNRYGVAIATGLEALRSFLVVPYLKSRKNPLMTNSDRSPQEDESNRREAENALRMAVEVIQGESRKSDASQSEQISKDITVLAEKMWEAFDETRPIRNTFAHNLKEDSCTASASSKGEEDLYDTRQIAGTEEIETAFEKCRVFFEVLEKFSFALSSNPDEAQKLLQMKPKGKSSGKKTVGKPKQAFIIWHDYNHERSEKECKHMRTAVLDGLKIQKKEERKLFPIMQYPQERLDKNGKIGDIVQYAYEEFIHDKADEITPVFYCDDREISTFSDYNQLLNLLPRLISSGFSEIYYVNLRMQRPKAEKISLNIFDKRG